MTVSDDKAIGLLNFANPEPPPEGIPWPDGLPPPGFYKDIPYAEYARWPAVNAHALIIGATVTPKHMKAYMDGEFSGGDSTDRKLGRGIHAGLLEPATFADRFPVATGCSALLKSGERKGQPCGCDASYRDASGAWYCGKHNPEDATRPADFLSGDEAARVERLRKSVFAHKVVRMLRAYGGCEVSLLWSQDGFPAKARLDKGIFDSGGGCPDTVIDLKKIQAGKGTEEDLQKAIRQFGYDVQGAWYVAGVHALRPDKPAPLYAWVFVEDAPPFDVRPVWASRAMLRVGTMKFERAFRNYVWCVRNNTWPGYADDIEEISPAAWECKRYGLEG